MTSHRRGRPWLGTPARLFLAFLCASVGLAGSSRTALGKGPESRLTPAEARAIRDKTLTIRLDADLSALSLGERRALDRLIEVGEIFQRLYEASRHHQALSAHADLVALDERLGSPERTRVLLDLYRLFRGPIATTLDNRRVPFLAVDAELPGKNLYPLRADRARLDAYVEGHPAALHPRSVVRASEPAAIEADLATLDRHPVLDALHPGLRGELERVRASAGRGGFHSVPYSVAYAEDLLQAHGLLWEAAEAIVGEDPDFAAYLRLRARDLLTDDYEGGDAAWVTGKFRNLNAQLGSYETYSDALYGVKTFFGASLLMRDRAKSEALASVTGGIQKVEESLPYSPRKRVREDIPVGVYDVIADFGDARGTNTATILPNESHLTRKYGRTILLRHNILTHPEIFDAVRTTFVAAVDPAHANDLDVEGDFNRILWHEIGHYLGPSRTADGRELDEALLENSSLLEELKADLVSLFAGPLLREQGFYSEASLKSLYASGIRRVLLRVRPRRDEPYGTMQLIQMNYFLENGLLRFDARSKRLRIHYHRYHEVVAGLLEKVLELQSRGDKTASEAFIARYASWEKGVHEVLAARMRAVEKHRFRLVRYAALGE